MVQVTGEQLLTATVFVRAEAELVVLSIKDYALPRRNRKVAFARAEMPAVKLERIATNRIDAEHAGLDAFMDD